MLSCLGRSSFDDERVGTRKEVYLTLCKGLEEGVGVGHEGGLRFQQGMGGSGSGDRGVASMGRLNGYDHHVEPLS